MKVLVFGATGPTGKEIVAQALEAGHEVRAFARDPASVSAWSPKLEVVRGDVLQWTDVGRAMRGVGAVLSALGTGANLMPTTLYSEGTAAILWAMAEAGVRRLVCVTSGATIEDPKAPFFFRYFGRRALRHIFADQRKAEERLQASDAEWTIVRPPRLLSVPKRGHYEVARDGPAGGSYQIGRADLADFMVGEMVAKKFVRAAVGIGYKK